MFKLTAEEFQEANKRISSIVTRDEIGCPLIFTRYFRHPYDVGRILPPNVAFYAGILEKLSHFSYPGVHLVVFGGFLARHFIAYPKEEEFDLDLTLLPHSDGELNERLSRKEKALTELVEFLQKEFSLKYQTFQKTSDYVLTGYLKDESNSGLNKIQIVNHPSINSPLELIEFNDFSLNQVCYLAEEKTYYLTQACLRSFQTKTIKLNFEQDSVGWLSAIRMIKYLRNGFAFFLPRLNLAKVLEFFPVGLRGIQIVGIQKEYILVSANTLPKKSLRSLSGQSYFSHNDPKSKLTTKPSSSNHFSSHLSEREFYGSAYLEPTSESKDGEKQFYDWDFPLGFNSLIRSPGKIYQFYTQVWGLKPEVGGLRYLGSTTVVKRNKVTVFEKGDFQFELNFPSSITDAPLIEVFYQGEKKSVIQQPKDDTGAFFFFLQDSRCLIYDLKDYHSRLIFLDYQRLKQNILPLFMSLSKYEYPKEADDYYHFIHLVSSYYPSTLETSRTKEFREMAYQRWTNEQPDYSYAFYLEGNRRLIQEDDFTSKNFILKKSYSWDLSKILSRWERTVKLYFHLGLLRCLSDRNVDKEESVFSYLTILSSEKYLPHNIYAIEKWRRYINIMKFLPKSLQKNVLRLLLGQTILKDQIWKDSQLMNHVHVGFLKFILIQISS